MRHITVDGLAGPSELLAAAGLHPVVTEWVAEWVSSERNLSRRIIKQV